MYGRNEKAEIAVVVGAVAGIGLLVYSLVSGSGPTTNWAGFLHFTAICERNRTWQV
jgi:ABC-type tungstate transport system substrate-binding protein